MLKEHYLIFKEAMRMRPCARTLHSKRACLLH